MQGREEEITDGRKEKKERWRKLEGGMMMVEVGVKGYAGGEAAVTLPVGS